MSMKALAPFRAEAIDGRRSRCASPRRPPANAPRPVEAAPAFEKGWFEVQDLGSQIAAARAGEIAHRQVLDFCAGGGGKTLALAAMMGNTGQLYAWDADARRLAETVKRARRAGVRNLQVRSPLDPEALATLAGPHGSGVRRRPVHRLGNLAAPSRRQVAPFSRATRGAHGRAGRGAGGAPRPLVKAGGRLIYVTCSLLAEENEDRIAAFLALTDGLRGHRRGQRLTPHQDGADGFFIAELARTE